MVFHYIHVTGKSANTSKITNMYVGKSGERLDFDPITGGGKLIRGLVKKYGYTSESSAEKAISKLKSDTYVDNDTLSFTFAVESVDYPD